MRGVVVIGASAGGITAIGELLAALPRDFRLPIVIAQHRAESAASALGDVLSNLARKTVRDAADGERISAGDIRVAPAGSHVVFDPGGGLRVWRGPRVRFVRPSIDMLFASAAQVCGANTAGAVLSGTGADGAWGTRAIRAADGFTLAQDEASARFPSMPAAAVELGHVDVVLPLAKLAKALAHWADAQIGVSA